jgi:post-segregation antitoxin (ccd killing protein)
MSIYAYIGVGERKHMTDKVKVNLTISKEVVEKAKEYGLNMSKVAENALKEYIRRLEGSSQQTETNGGYADTRSVSHQHDWWAGPDLNRRSSPREGDVIVKLFFNHAGLPAHNV